MDLNELSNNPDQVKQLISMLQKLLPVDNKQEENISPIKTKGRRQEKNTTEKNKFLSMREKDMHKDDTKIDKALNCNNPVARSREFSMIKATCRICGKTEEINPALLFDSPTRYKCNNCCTSAG